jgi:hypothetical protein
MVNFTGPDSFRFTIHNGVTESRPALVQIMVLPSSGDTTPPEVLWTWPADGASIDGVMTAQVTTDTLGPIYAPALLAQFSESLHTATVTTDTVRVEDESGGAVDVTPAYVEWSRWLSLVPREPWRTGTYTATLTTGLQDASGNPLAANHQWSFNMTASAQGIYLPLVVKRMN